MVVIIITEKNSLFKIKSLKMPCKLYNARCQHLKGVKGFCRFAPTSQFWSKLFTQHVIKMGRNAKQLFPGMVAAPVCKLLEGVMMSMGERERGGPLGFIPA